MQMIEVAGLVREFTDTGKILAFQISYVYVLTRGVPKVFANERTMKDTVKLIVPSSAAISHHLCRIKSASCYVAFLPYSTK